MRCFSILIGVAALWLSGAESPAEDGVPDPKALFEELDKNGDGKLVSEEIPKEQTRFFERLLRKADKNEDGRLSLDEFLEGHKSDDGPGLPLNGLGGPAGRGGANLKQRFEMLDRNKDGKVTREEVPEFARERLRPLFERLAKEELTLEDFRQLERQPGGGQDPARLFEQLDTNADGKLTADDKPKDGARRILDQLLRRTGKTAGAELTKEEFLTAMAARSGDRPSMDRAGERPPNPRFVQLLDADRDGRISKAEWAKAADLFATLDQDEDGSLDLTELLGPPPEVGRMPPREDGAAGAAGGFFARMDADKDGKISKDEAPPRLRNRFDRLDRDKDGFLSPEELGPRPKSPEGNPRPKRPPQE